MQRISVAVQIAAATEIRQALGRGVSPDSVGLDARGRVSLSYVTG